MTRSMVNPLRLRLERTRARAPWQPIAGSVRGSCLEHRRTSPRSGRSRCPDARRERLLPIRRLECRRPRTRSVRDRRRPLPAGPAFGNAGVTIPSWMFRRRGRVSDGVARTGLGRAARIAPIKSQCRWNVVAPERANLLRLSLRREGRAEIQSLFELLSEDLGGPSIAYDCRSSMNVPVWSEAR